MVTIPINPQRTSDELSAIYGGRPANTEDHIRTDGGTVVINPPFGEYREPPHRIVRKNWKKSWRWFGVYFTLSNCRVKLRNHNRTERLAQDSRNIKSKMYEQSQGICPHCGKHFEINYMELHHILPWARFPELRTKRKNQVLLCHDCHKEIHCNPYLNIRLMEAKAKEFGIDLNERYDYE